MIRRVLAALALVSIAACNPRSPNGGASPSPSPTASSSASLPPLRVVGKGSAHQPVRFIESKDNREQFEIVTRSFESHGTPGKAVLTYNDVDITFVGKDGTKLFATAPHATLDQRSNTVVLTGGVHASNNQGMKLTCDRLVYDRQTEMVHGDGNVHISNPNGFNGSGSHFDSDISLTHTRMT